MSLDSYVTLGRSGLRVSPFCLGAMTFGGSSWGADETVSTAILDAYVERGGNFVDTANGYNNGRSEEIIGSYLSHRPDLRDRLVVSTKFAGNMFPGDPNGGGAGRKAILRQVHASLRRLRTDHIDVYWLHNADRHTPIEETMSALDDLVRAGTVRYIAISDTPAWLVARAQTLAELRDRTPVTAIQVEYSLLARTVEGELVPMACELGIGIMPWAPLAGGVLTGKYTRNDDRPEGSRRAARGGAELGDQTFAVVAELTRIAGDASTSLGAVALAWLRTRPGVSSIIIGSRNVEQLADNVAALDVELSPADIVKLDELTTPTLNFPAAFLETTAISWQQGGTTINDVASQPLNIF